MIANFKCEDCCFLIKCVAYAKLKPFVEDAQRDLGITLTFDTCNDYKSTKDTNNKIGEG